MIHSKIQINVKQMIFSAKLLANESDDLRKAPHAHTLLAKKRGSEREVE